MAIKTNKLPVKSFSPSQLEALALSKGLSVTDKSAAKPPTQKILLPKKEFLKRSAKALADKMPKSERWFHRLYEASGLNDKRDKINVPFNDRFIPDVINFRYKYVIEVNGSIHNQPEMQARDAIKYGYYTSKGYKVFVVEAYSQESFDRFLEDMLVYRSELSG